MPAAGVSRLPASPYSSRCILVLALVAIAAFGAPSRGRAAEGEDLRHDLADDHCVSYTISRLDGADGQEQPVPQPDRSFFFFGRELSEGRRLGLTIRRLEDVPYAAIFRLPKKAIETGETWRDEVTFSDLPEQAPLRLELSVTAAARGKLDEHEVWKLEGKGALPRDAARPKGSKVKRWVREAALEWVAYWDPELRAIRRLRYFWRTTVAPMRGDGGETKTKQGEQLEYRDRLAPATQPLRDRIADAITRGVDNLKRAQKEDGSWKGVDAVWHEGNTALMLLALIRSGIYAHDPIVARGFEYLKKQPFRRVYSVALLVLALEARYTPLEEIRAAEDYLDDPTQFKPQERRLPPEDREWMQKAIDWLLANALNKRTWSYDEPKGRYDNSNTQYAALAFDSAARCGVAIDARTWRGVAEHFLQVQNKRGAEVKRRVRPPAGAEGGTQVESLPARARGWGYQDAAGDYGPTGTTYASMTCAGLTALYLARTWLAHVKELDKALAGRLDAGIHDGLAWLETHWDPRYNAPRWDEWYYYYLYGVERVGVLAGSKYFGDRDWYAEGAMALCNLQASGGGWGRYEYDTAFALLFLKKGTVPALTR